MARFEIKVSVRKDDWAGSSAPLQSMADAEREPASQLCIEDTPNGPATSAMNCTPDTPERLRALGSSVDTGELSAMNCITTDTPELSAMNCITIDTPELSAMECISDTPERTARS